MLTSISPLGERARRNRWSWTAGWYVASSVLSAAAAGAALGEIGALVGLPVAVRAIAWAVLAAIAVLVDVGTLPLPTWHRQVNEDWLNRYRAWVYGSGFGAQLGLGVATIVTTAAVYLTLEAELSVGSLAGGAVIGVAFGAVRAAPILGVAKAVTFDELTARHRRLMALAAPVRRATVAVMSLGVIAAGLVAISEIA